MDDLNKNAYLRIVDFIRQAILDIDSITKLLIELVTDIVADSDGLEGLGLPESEPLLKTAIIEKVLNSDQYHT